MRTTDLNSLETLTRDYASFQSRKSGLGTALGGLMVLLFFWVAVLPDVFKVRLLQRPALEVFLFAPLIWLMLKSALARFLYRGLGSVKAMPDLAYERRRWLWIFGMAIVLMGFLVTAIYGFTSGALLAAKPIVMHLSPEQPLFHPWGGLIWLPILYLAPMPWAIRGIEEARAYSVLVGQCLLWMTLVFLFAFGAYSPVQSLPKVASVLASVGLVALILGIAIWAPLTMVRGWKEHREYLAMLRALPGEP